MYPVSALVNNCAERVTELHPPMSSPEQAAGSWSITSFRSSLVPMVITDDERRYVAVNRAACLLLQLSEKEALELRIEDLTPPQNPRRSRCSGVRSCARGSREGCSNC
jgi:PAS domain-containing protein